MDTIALTCISFGFLSHMIEIWNFSGLLLERYKRLPTLVVATRPYNTLVRSRHISEVSIGCLTISVSPE